MDDFIPVYSTKHEQILKYIEGLKVGQKISVRMLARELEVSEGTAYRAIKDAEKQGIVSTKERMGTVRIERQQREQIEHLTFSDVKDMVNGQVLGGGHGLDKHLKKFVIGAMEQDAMMQYIAAGSLLIVGNRSKAHQLALESGAAVLITGGFDATEEIKQLADQYQMPIISSEYDTFTVASMINRAMYDRLIKRKIMLIEDILTEDTATIYLKLGSTVSDWRRMLQQTGQSRFPVVDEWGRVCGMLTSKDVIDAEPHHPIDRLMTKEPKLVYLHTSIASAAHRMVWEGIELLPVVDHHRKLLGSISRQDVLKAMQHIQKQPQLGETFEDLIWMEFEARRTDDGRLVFSGIITPQMTSHLGTGSEGVLSILITKAAYEAINEVKRGDLVLDNITTYFVKPVQIESHIEIRTGIIEASRKFAKAEVEIHHGGDLVCKAMLTAQVIDQI